MKVKESEKLRLAKSRKIAENQDGDINCSGNPWYSLQRPRKVTEYLRKNRNNHNVKIMKILRKVR